MLSPDCSGLPGTSKKKQSGAMRVWGKLTPGVAALGKKKSTSALPDAGREA